MRIDLRIERLVLDEALLGGARARDVRESIERELGRLLLVPGAADSLRRLGTLDALPPIHLSGSTGRYVDFGTSVADALGRGFGLEANAIDLASRPAPVGAKKE